MITYIRCTLWAACLQNCVYKQCLLLLAVSTKESIKGGAAHGNDLVRGICISEARVELNWSGVLTIFNAMSHFSHLQYHVREICSLVESGMSWVTQLICVGLSECSTSWTNNFSYLYNVSSL